MISTRQFLLNALSVLVALAAGLLITRTASAAETRLPNIVLIFMDDLGYADIGAFGAKAYPTPNLDHLAKEGCVFSDFHAATAVCSASRAALLTGCYPERVSILGALRSEAKIGLNPGEVTLAEICKQKNYATACVGKWHLGHRAPFLPQRQGFDSYFGVPYSNDMTVDPTMSVADDCVFRDGSSLEKMRKEKPAKGQVPLMRGDKVIEYPADQSQLTTRYTEEAVKFIHANRERPFFLYLPHTMVHIPLHVSDKFKGKSSRGLFGDVMMEVDWSIGQVMDALKQAGVEDNTLVIFTSDNGPWLIQGQAAGSAKPLREGKGTMWEGGYREPTIMRWPGKIKPSSKCDQLASTMDIMPTVAKYIGATLPEHKIDGHDILPLLTGEPGAKSPWDVMYCYYGRELRAVRDGRWKLVLPHSFIHVPTDADGVGNGKSEKVNTELALYDLQNDVSESKDVKDEHPDIVARLSAAAEAAREELGDLLTKKTTSKGVRPSGQVD